MILALAAGLSAISFFEFGVNDDRHERLSLAVLAAGAMIQMTMTLSWL